MERSACESHVVKKKTGRILKWDENKNYDNRVNTLSLRNSEIKKKIRRKHRFAYRKKKTQRTPNQVSATIVTDAGDFPVEVCTTSIIDADDCPVEASAAQVTADGDWSANFDETSPLAQATLEDCAKQPIPVLDWDLNFDETTPFVQAILGDSAKKPNQILDTIPVEECGIELMTDEKFYEEPVNHLPANELDSAIVDLVLEIEEDTMKDDYHMEELVEFSEDLVFSENAPKWVLKYGSANPLLSQKTAPVERTWIYSDSDESDNEENPRTFIHLMHCDVLQYLKALETHLELDDFPTVKLLLNTLGSAIISVDCLIDLQDEIFVILMKALTSSQIDVVHSAKKARTNWMTTLSENEFETAKIAYFKLWLTKT